MGGVKIPNWTSLGTPSTPEAPTSVASIGNASAPAQATAQQYSEIYKSGSELQDLYNKSAVNNAFINFNDKLRDAATQYYSLSGSDAVKALPAFNAQVAQLKQGATDGITDIDAMTKLQGMIEDNSQRHLYGAALHADDQAKKYALDTHKAMLSDFVSDVANNHGDQGVYDLNMKNSNAEIDAYGQKTGMSPEAIQNDKNNFSKDMEMTRYTSMASEDVNKAYSVYQQNKSAIPGEVQTKLDAWFKPQVRESALDGYINGLPAQLGKDATSGSGVSANNLGNVKTAAGAANNTADFVNPSTPVDGAMLAANNLRNNYQGMTLQQIGAKWTGEPDKAADWVSNASKASGIAPDAVPNLNDPGQLQKVLKGMNIAENAPAKAANFSDDVISKGVQASLAGQQPSTSKPAPNPMPTSAYQTQADYMAANRPALIENAREWAQKNYPNDPTMENMAKQRVDNMISTAVQAQTASYKQDNQTVMKAISGDMSNGNPPTSIQQLRALPGISDVMNRVAIQDSKFYDGIDRMVGQMASRNTTINSPNGFETIMRSSDPINPTTLGPSPNSIDSQDKLNSLLGRSDGNGINVKDYNDAKPLMEASQDWKDYVHQNMQTIANANGNIDGQGQARALQWYQNTMQGYKSASGQQNFDVKDYIQKLTDAASPPAPSRMEQLSNWAKTIWNGAPESAQPQTISVLSPTGQAGTIPAANLDKALAAGYKKVQ